MNTQNQRRFTPEEREWMALNAAHMTQSFAARKLGVRVTAVNNWAFRHKVNFLGSKRKLVKAAVIPKKPVIGEMQDVDRLMYLAAKARA